ncbi:MAG: hypothetical protein N2381_11300, partial [Armatimonadetes bacterium]|nr:hypothetical protein [Armatimonadota bacterium]
YALEQATKALHLLCLFGGIGRRSRRGFGSLQIVGGDLPALEVNTSEEFCSEVKKRLKEITKDRFTSIDSVPSFPILHPGWAQVKV